MLKELNNKRAQLTKRQTHWKQNCHSGMTRNHLLLLLKWKRRRGVREQAGQQPQGFGRGRDVMESHRKKRPCPSL